MSRVLGSRLIFMWLFPYIAPGRIPTARSIIKAAPIE